MSSPFEQRSDKAPLLYIQKRMTSDRHKGTISQTLLISAYRQREKYRFLVNAVKASRARMVFQEKEMVLQLQAEDRQKTSADPLIPHLFLSFAECLCY